MFRQYTTSNPTQANALFTKHPLEIAALIERVWFGRVVPPPGSAPFPANPFVNFPANPFAGGPISLPFEHLIYAYMTENTRIYDIFRRVVLEYVQGEKLEIPSIDGQRWLRTTEELFFRDPPSFLSFTLTSQLRPDTNATSTLQRKFLYPLSRKSFAFISPFERFSHGVIEISNEI